MFFWSASNPLISEVGQTKLSSMPLLASKLPSLKSQLISSLLASLSLPSTRKSGAVSLITLLNRLQAGSAARTTFLEMRAQVIHSHMRKIRFEGDIGTYVGELSIVYFTGIKHTADWYLASFKENEVASCMWDFLVCPIFANIVPFSIYHLDQAANSRLCRNF